MRHLREELMNAKISLILIIPMAWFALSIGDADDKFPPKKKNKTETSRLYEQFDPAALKEKYIGEFSTRDIVSGHTRGLIITPPGERFRTFRIKGEISDDGIDRVWESLQKDVIKIVDASGATLLKKPVAEIRDQPWSLFPALFGEEFIQISTLRGFYLEYEQGGIRGGIDIFVNKAVHQDQVQWNIVCALHESV